ncbi:MAG: hypothetical protein GW822_11395 [Sphingomonadales bacterium]|nr:hypothetical protein [Sphingomonadales bacterium]NCO50332.1 hypothetical protein [Sphingomonadales bacterium]NCP00958.1 hypothetical protein [Sphingomonadales bacterium]NCP28087.1 hypothetical protein [Sphingomonadales bacterium]NCP44024.1 hypothetical protein [Sphingomonadales bacterium]
MNNTSRSAARISPMPISGRITANVSSMIDQGADEQEIDDYIASEGHTVESFKSGQPLTVMVGSEPESDRSVVDLARQEMIDAGMPEAEIQKFSKEQGLPDYAPQGSSATDNIQGSAAALLDGVIPYLSDNVAGVSGVINNGWRSALGMEDFDPSAGFESGKIKFRGARDRFEEDHPYIDGGLQTAGFVGSLALPVTKFGQAAHAAEGANAASKTGNAVLNGSATGALYGTAGGALNDTGGGRVENAGLGGLTGAAFGSTVPLAFRSLGSLGSMVRRNVPGVDGVASSVGNSARQLVGLPQAPPATQQQAHRMAAESIAAPPPVQYARRCGH